VQFIQLIQRKTELSLNAEGTPASFIFFIFIGMGAQYLPNQSVFHWSQQCATLGLLMWKHLSLKAPWYPNEHCFVSGPRPCLLTCLIIAIWRWVWVWSTDSIILTVENQSIQHGVANHLVQPFIRFAGTSYTWYVNVCSGTVGDK